jgi:general L-amino acid transport system permease protein
VRSRSVAGQAIALGLAAAVLWWLANNTVATLASHGIALGFGFLGQPANFAIGDAPIAYSPADTFARAIVVGLANTARVSLLGWIFAVALGFLLGTMRLAENPPVRGVARAVVELVRNVPLLLVLLFLAAVVHTLPPAGRALHPLPGVFISDRGLVVPALALSPVGISWPTLQGFNFVGGWTISPELTALLAALVLHHAAHISEVVRGAVLAVPQRQRDAASALGLTRRQTMRFVVLPQALRAMVPLLATNCVSLTKNSSLAVAIGFPDLVSILNTTSNQTGHAIETMLIMIAVYLVLSLAIASAMNAYNRRLLRVSV